MEHRDRGVELWLDRWATGNWEIYFTEFSNLTYRMFMLMLSNGWADKSRAARKSKCRDEQKRSHEKVLLRLRANFRAFFTNSSVFSSPATCDGSDFCSLSYSNFPELAKVRLRNRRASL
jgi:hypothetical protein